MKAALHLYFGRIEVHGLENVPKTGAVLFLPNHQKALIDVLLIVTDCHRKPYFLTRSDVFNKQVLRRFFAFLQMIPIYRMRDGRNQLKNNEAVFKKCTELFENEEAIVLFPEANHNLRRRVRNLSKGFTRIVFHSLKQSPSNEILMIPVGLNYLKSTGFPDKVAVYYGKPIVSSQLYDPHDVFTSVQNTKKQVKEQLKQLTTHIEDEPNYEAIIQIMEEKNVNFLNPMESNKFIKSSESKTKRESGKNSKPVIFKSVFQLCNVAALVPWRLWMKPKVWEPEFLSTLRFAYAMVVYPICYILFLSLFTAGFGFGVAIILVFFHVLFNWAYVKGGP